MDVFTVSLFGHREMDDLRGMESKLAPIVRELIRGKEYVSFLIGRNGEFDEYAASVIKRVQKETGKENSEMILVLPYRVADLEFYEKYYDGIFIPDGVSGAHFKNAITLRNRWMVDASDLVICYAQRESGGAAAAMKYAKKKNKGVIELSVLAEGEE